jgi:transposase
VSDRTLWYWVSEERKARERAEDPTALTADEAAELKRLRKENAQQREDMEILRKAAAYFAKETLR